MRIIVTCVLALAGLTASACGEDPTDTVDGDIEAMQAEALYVRPLPFVQPSTTPDRPRIPRITPVPVPGGGDFDPSDELELSGDAQIMLVLLTLNSGEIAMANEALLRLRTGQTRDFATAMRDEHRRANLKLRSVLDETGIVLKASDVSARLREDTLADLEVLRAANADEVDKAFIDGQVKAHRRALDIIEELLLPLAEHDDVRALVSAMRTDVEHHLALALRLRTLADHDGLTETPL